METFHTFIVFDQSPFHEHLSHEGWNRSGLKCFSTYNIVCSKFRYIHSNLVSLVLLYSMVDNQQNLRGIVYCVNTHFIKGAYCQRASTILRHSKIHIYSSNITSDT